MPYLYLVIFPFEQEVKKRVQAPCPWRVCIWALHTFKLHTGVFSIPNVKSFGGRVKQEGVRE
jgi:hypothetical protein